MTKKRLGFVVPLFAAAWTLVAMGHKMTHDQEDTTFDAKAEATKDPHVADAVAEKKPVGLPSSPADVEKDTARDFKDPFFKESGKDPDLDPQKE